MYPITLIVILQHVSVSNQHTVHLKFTWCSSLVAQMVKRLPTMRKTWVRSLGREDPWRRKWQPTPVLLPGKSHGWTSVVGYSPWGRKESDTTERLHFHFHLFIKMYHNPGKEICSYRAYICSALFGTDKQFYKIVVTSYTANSV